jgi:uncharacterized protein (DUF305 family)
MRSRILVGVVAAGALVLVACGGNSKAFNDSDVQFAQGMIPHHQQAVEMADLAVAKAASPEVKDLATRIKAAQDPEIQQMTAWLKDWDKPLEASSDMEGMDHGSGSGSGTAMGVMTAEAMANLEAAAGDEFDTMFLEMMIRHHQGAIDMAKQEQSKGKFADTKALADSIVTSQQAEIDAMKHAAR